MSFLSTVLKIIGSLGLFLYGMKIMSDGVQKAAGDRLQQAINFMTGNRVIAVITGVAVTALVQSSSATTVMVVSFVNAGLLTLTQSIGVIFGANIGTTITAWVISLVGFKLSMSALALPAIGIGFILTIFVKLGRKDLGEAILGFGLLFLGLDFLTKSLPEIGPEHLVFIRNLSGMGFLSVLIAVGASVLMTVIVHSSSASTAIILTLAFKGMIDFNMAAAMILGANIGTTIDAFLASITAKAMARRSALVHILFNVIGSLIAIALFKPFVSFILWFTPGEAVGTGITTHLAMLHTMFNLFNTLLFLPFVNPIARLVTHVVKDDIESAAARYKLVYATGSIQDTPELNVLRAEKEIRDMAGIVENMFDAFSSSLGVTEKGKIEALVEELRQKEDYADKMREELTSFLLECSRQKLSKRSEQHVTSLLRIVSDLELMTDDCFSLSLILERSVAKRHFFDKRELEALTPYVELVREFLRVVHKNLGQHMSSEQMQIASDLEERIDKFRDRLRKTARKRLEAGADVKTELLFIDLVRRIEKLGDYSYSITEALGRIS